MEPRRFRFLTALLALLLALQSTLPALAQSATPVSDASPVASIERGIQLADMDLSVDPAEDFYRFANGGWLDRTEIPADRASWGVFDDLNQRTSDVQLDILERSAGDPSIAEGSDQWKVVQLFAQGTDTATRNANGLSPLDDEFAAIDAITDAASFHQYMVDHSLDGASGIFSVFVFGDLLDSSVNAAYLSGPLLGLPNRDYYLEDDPANEAVRTAYIDANTRFLVLLGRDETSARATAEAIYEMEKAAAGLTLTREQQQDFSNFYNPMTTAELSAAYPDLDWAAYMESLGITDAATLIVTEKTYLQGVAELVAATPVETLKDFLRLQLLWFAAPYLDEASYDIYFSLQGQALSGVETPLPKEQRVLNHVNTVMGQAVGQLYVAEVFPPEAKAQIESLAGNVLDAFRGRLESNLWMSDVTRATALDKLDKVGLKVGYPDVWRSYDEVVVEDAYVSSIISATIADAKRQYAQVGKPVDRTEWSMNPQEVNAYYDAQNNEIVFPAAILQPPFFDYQADLASNYGAIGYVIGHEITHGFDITGSQFDAQGNLAQWWTAEDNAAFEALQAKAVEQYSAIEVLPGLFVDGQITVGENVADLGGIQNAYAALEMALAIEGDPGEIDGFTQQQRFFIAAAQVWREKIRDEALTTQVKADEHAPGSVRATQPSRNADAFYDAFAISETAPMYLPPDQRIVIW